MLLSSPHLSIRGGEYLDAAEPKTGARPRVVLQSGHNLAVYCLAESRDGSLVLSGGSDCTIRLWDARGTLTRVIHTFGIVESAVFSPDGSRIYAAIDVTREETGGVIAVYDLKGEQIRSWKLRDSYYAKQIAVSPDGAVVAAGTYRSLYLWSADGTLIRKISSPALALDFSPDGKFIASTPEYPNKEKKFRIEIRDAKGNDVASWDAPHEKKVNSLRYSPDGRLILTASDDGTMKLVTPAGTVKTSFQNQGSPVRCAAFTRDGRKIVSGHQDGGVLMWTADGSPVSAVKKHTEGVTGVLPRGDGGEVLSSSYDGYLRRWAVSSGKSSVIGYDSYAETDWVKCAVIDHTGSWIAWGSQNGNLRLHGLLNNDKSSIDAHPKAVTAIAIHPRSKYLATASGDGTMKIFTPYPLALRKTFQGHGKSVNSLAFSPDGGTLGSASSDTTVRLWDFTGRQKLRIDPPAGRDAGSVFSVLFNPRGNFFAAGYADGLIGLFNTQGRMIGQYAGHDNHVNGLAFSADGSMLASGGSDKLLIIWNSNYRPEAKYKMEFNEISAVAWSPREELVATAGYDTAIRLWNRKGQVRVLVGHESFINSLNFTPDGRFLISGSSDGTIKIWKLATGACLTVVNLFNNEDYLDYDSDGHFDANDYGKGLFTVFKGDTAYRPEEVWNELYRPGLLPKFMHGEAY